MKMPGASSAALRELRVRDARESLFFEADIAPINVARALRARTCTLERQIRPMARISIGRFNLQFRTVGLLRRQRRLAILFTCGFTVAPGASSGGEVQSG